MSWCENIIIDWSQVKEVVLSIVAIVTVYIAWRGLDKWQSELRGKAHFETARNLARAVFKVRDAMQSCRSPMIWAQEFEDLDPSSRSGTERGDAYGKVFSKRFAPVRMALQELDAANLEAEALWGSDIVNSVDALRTCAVSLSSAMQAFVSNERDLGSHFESDKTFGVKMRSTVFASHDDRDNPLTQQIASSVKRIEILLKPHLKR